MKTEDQIRQEYQALYVVKYEQAVQSGLPAETAKQIADQAVAEKAIETIKQILNPARMAGQKI